MISVQTTENVKVNKHGKNGQSKTGNSTRRKISLIVVIKTRVFEKNSCVGIKTRGWG